MMDSSSFGMLCGLLLSLYHVPGGGCDGLTVASCWASYSLIPLGGVLGQSCAGSLMDARSVCTLMNTWPLPSPPRLTGAGDYVL